MCPDCHHPRSRHCIAPPISVSTYRSSISIYLSVYLSLRSIDFLTRFLAQCVTAFISSLAAVPAVSAPRHILSSAPFTRAPLFTLLPSPPLPRPRRPPLLLTRHRLRRTRVARNPHGTHGRQPTTPPLLPRSPRLLPLPLSRPCPPLPRLPPPSRRRPRPLPSGLPLCWA